MLEQACDGGVLLSNEDDTARLGAELAHALAPDDTVLLSGQLGAGKTTLVRGLLRELGFEGGVRSPTFTLMQVYELGTRVVHADLYRVASSAGVGLEDELGASLCLIEWPDRLKGVDESGCWTVDLQFDADHRRATVTRPGPS